MKEIPQFLNNMYMWRDCGIFYNDIMVGWGCIIIIDLYEEYYCEKKYMIIMIDLSKGVEYYD